MKTSKKSVQDNVVYSVWVGGGEINDDYINEFETALHIANCWRSSGHDDVAVERLEIDPVNGDIITSRFL
jgi:hypothetical protein